MTDDPKTNGDPKQTAGAQKPPLHLNPPVGALHQSMAQLNGAMKYGEFNWRKGNGVEVMTYIGAIERHIGRYKDGEEFETDPKTGVKVHHLGAIMATAAIVLDAESCGKLIDNRPPKGAAGLTTDKLMGVKTNEI